MPLDPPTPFHTRTVLVALPAAMEDRLAGMAQAYGCTMSQVIVALLHTVDLQKLAETPPEEQTL